MSRVVRLPSEAEEQSWETEDDDMAEGDLGYGLGRRPGGIYEVQVSHLFTSRKKSAGKSFSPLPFSRNEEEKNAAIFQYSKHKNLQETYPAGSRILHHSQQSSTGKNAQCPLLCSSPLCHPSNPQRWVAIMDFIFILLHLWHAQFPESGIKSLLQK